MHLSLVPKNALKNEFDIDEFPSIPANELVNVDVVIAERWLEENPFPNEDPRDDVYKPLENLHKCNDDDSIPCGPLNVMVLQLKFKTKSR